MAYKDINGLDRSQGESNTPETLKLQIMGETVELPHDSFVRDADISRENMDLVLDSSDGTIIIQDYFAGFESPALTAPSGASLSPQLVNSFISSGNEYASTETTSDVSPVGAVQEISGDATITRVNGTTETLSIGSPVYQGDVIETDADSAVNVVFVDESSFAVSEETRLAIDEYVFDPASQGGVQNFSVLKGVFVYTSGLIGREDPDDVSIDTPVGSIGIRGTIIAGDVNQGEITVVEGAIVLRNPAGEEMTLANQFETGRFTADSGIQNIGQKSANDVVEKFSIVSTVAPNLFSSINDAAAESQQAEQRQDAQPTDSPANPPQMDTDKPAFDADGATDQDGDSQVDGTVDNSGATGGDDGAMLDGMNNPAEQQESKDAQTAEAPMMNPMAMQIAQAMGMMDGQSQTMNAGGNMAGTMGGMQSMTAMGMATEDVLAEGETVMEMLNDTTTETQTGAMGDNATNDPSQYNNTNPDTIRDNGSNMNGGTGTGGANVAPSVLSNTTIGIPDAYFSASGGNNFQFNAAEIFQDAGPLTYQLTGATIDALNGTTLTAGGNILTNVLNSWNFDQNTGTLDLNFNTDYTGTAWGGFTTDDFLIGVVATDAAGLSSNVFSHNMTLFGGASITDITADINTAGAGDVFINTGVSNFNVNVSDVFVFADNTDNMIDLGGPATNVQLHTANGDDHVTISSGGHTGSNIYLGYGNDTFELTGSSFANNTQVHGMDGNDTFIFTGTALNAMQAGTGTSENAFFDGGTNSAGNIVNGNFDKIVLQDGGNIDFSVLQNGTNNNQFRNFELIDTNNGLANTVTLSFGDVLGMTDDRNRLVLETDAADSVSLNGFAAFGDTVADGTQVVGADTYDIHIFSDGTNDVTLLVDQAAGVTIS